MIKHLEYFDGAFDASVTEKVKPENKPYVAYSKTEGVVYTIIPKEDGTMYTVYRVVSKDISNCTYNMVDLGLSVKWADRNVGATSPEHYGSYFQWGDTKGFTYDRVGEVTAAELAKTLNTLLGPELGMEITADNVGAILEKMGMTDTDLTSTGLGIVLGKEFNWDSYFDTKDGGSTFNKYNNNGGLTVLESVDDAATTHMGSNYRMPTITEFRELIDNTTPTFIDLQRNEFTQEEAINGAISRMNFKGIKLTGTNGNSIFIPAAGYCYEAMLGGVGDLGRLCSSSLYENYSMYGRYLNFGYDGHVYEDSRDRYYGLSVRGIQA